MILTEEKRLQLLSYIVHAGEILQKEDQIPKHLYKYAYLPAGPEIYTGTLKAAGYLFIDKNINDIIFVIKQNDYSDDIIGYGELDFLIRGRKIKNNSSKIAKKVMPITIELFDQLLYSRLLTKAESVTILGIGENVNYKDLELKLDKIKKDNQGIIYIGGASTCSKDKDIDMINNIISKKLYKSESKWLGNFYINTIKTSELYPELVVYIHSSDLGINSSQQIGYICMVG